MSHLCQHVDQRPTFKEAFLFWLKLGFISFGGPAGQIAIMNDLLVTQRRWISQSRFLHALNYCMLLPGPEAQQLATYIGWLLHGRRGGLVAGMLFVLPSMFILLGLSMVYVLYGTLPWVQALFAGLKPAVIAIILLALLKIARRSLHGPFHYVIALGAFVGIFFFQVPFPLIILSALLLGVLMRALPSRDGGAPGIDGLSRGEEEGYFINSGSGGASITWSYRSLLLDLGMAAFFWTLPFLLFRLLAEDTTFWDQLALFFTKAALVTFGGAYAVLPYVAQVSVEQLHWLSELQMVDGLALGETTPGPLIMVLSFVGFMAGYHEHGFSLAMGALGLLVTVWYTFLPCFLFIFAGAPVIERTRNSRSLKVILQPVTAAVVGVILNLAIYLGMAVLFPRGLQVQQVDVAALVWVLVSVVAMQRFKLGMIPWLGISALAGLLLHLATGWG
jgi:chromate transporter